jgi:predicted DNA-binding transcriptional regulator
MDYIKKTLGLEIERRDWKGQSQLPYYLLHEYDFEAVTIGNCQCLFLKPKATIATTNNIKKHLKSLKKLTDRMIVFELRAITRQRKASLVEAKIPFVIPGKQLYLPFLGAVLQERGDSEQDTFLASQKLMPSSQTLLFAFLLGKNKLLYLSDAAKQFGISAMSISRAASQLEQIGLVTKKSEGVRKYIVSDTMPKLLFEEAKTYLINPVRKTVYIDNDEILPDMFSSGLTALSDISILNPPLPKTIGTAQSAKGLKGISTQLINGDTQSILHVWRYDPRLISGTDKVDALSLSVSLSGIDDERVEQALEALLREVL